MICMDDATWPCDQIDSYERKAMSKLKSLQELYTHQLKDLYSAENQILKALPRMIQATSSADLQNAFEDHLQRTEEHVRRLERVAELAGKSLKGQKCKGMEGLIKEGQELLKKDAEPMVLDAALIAAAQRIEHYEIAGYGTLRAYAQLLGNRAEAELLQQTLDEEGEADKRLSVLADSGINIKATAGYQNMRSHASRVDI
jgi:ferritin-like metal-binding protein YciE